MSFQEIQVPQGGTGSFLINNSNDTYGPVLPKLMAIKEGIDNG